MEKQKKEKQIERINKIYEENQKLGYRINFLNDQNNFYRISINNIKKLNCNIQKSIIANKTTSNQKNMSTHANHIIDEKNITQPYTIINNKIQLKNLQMKVGNSKRKTQKMKKAYDGSISSLLKKVQILEEQINISARQYEYYIIQNLLLSNIYLADRYEQNPVQPTNLDRKAKQRSTVTIRSSKKILNIDLQKQPKKLSVFSQAKQNPFLAQSNREKIQFLQDQQIKFANKLQSLRKEQKHIKKQKLTLIEQIKQLKIDQARLRSAVKEGRANENFRELQANEVNKLLSYNQEEQKLLEQIHKQDMLLQEQYKINQQYRQKIIDRNEQENKEIKVLQEEIQKCKEQVRQIKQKYEQMEIIKGTKFKRK